MITTGMSKLSRLLPALLIAAAMSLSTGANAQRLSPECGVLDNVYGPFDYTNPMHFNEKLPIVEGAHFDVGVESLKGHLRKPGGASMLASDIDYTLRAFPNHHRALYAMMRYYTDRVSRGASRMRYSADCYFQRASIHAPTDATVAMINGMFMQRMDKLQEAREHYDRALALSPRAPEIHYNAGLLYLEIGDTDTALKHAQQAYEAGYPLPGLRNKLRKQGVWEETQASTN